MKKQRLEHVRELVTRRLTAFSRLAPALDGAQPDSPEWFGYCTRAFGKHVLRYLYHTNAHPDTPGTKFASLLGLVTLAETKDVTLDQLIFTHSEIVRLMSQEWALTVQAYCLILQQALGEPAV